MTDIDTHVVTAERALVGALMLQPLAHSLQVLEAVRDEDLADPHLRIVMTAIRTLANQGIAPQAVAVLSHLRSEGCVSTSALPNLALLLTQLVSVDSVPLPAALDFYADATLEEAVRRELTAIGTRLHNLSNQSSRQEVSAHGRLQAACIVESVNRLEPTHEEGAK